MLDIFQLLAGAIVNAAGGDIYNETKTKVIDYLSRFESKSNLKQDLDATQRRVKANPRARELETDLWAEELARIAATSAEAYRAILELSRQVTYDVNQSNDQRSGNYSQNQNLNVTFINGGNRVEYDSDPKPNQDDEAFDPSDANEPTGLTGPKNFKAIGFAIALIVVIVVCAYACSGGNTTSTSAEFPLHGGRWPVGATTAGVLAPVVRGLSNCADVPVLSPANCPQSLSDSYSGVSDVHWSLHGDAGNGADIKYVDNQFEIAGNAVMTVSYRDSGGNRFSLQLIHYRAWVDWNKGSPNLTSITSFGSGAPPAINKHQTSVVWTSLTSAVLSAFQQCASYKLAPLPQQCPNDPSTGINGSNVSWQLNNNPVGNASACFDTTWGLIHVTGSFYMTAKYHVFLLGTQHGVEQGNYNATAAVDGSRIDVLRIVDQGSSTAC